MSKYTNKPLQVIFMFLPLANVYCNSFSSHWDITCNTQVTHSLLLKLYLVPSFYLCSDKCLFLYDSRVPYKDSILDSSVCMALNCSHAYLPLVFQVCFLKGEVQSLSFWNQACDSMVGTFGENIFFKISDPISWQNSGIFTGYGKLHWQYFSFNTLKYYSTFVLFVFCFISIVSGEKSSILWVIGPFSELCCFSLVFSRCFALFCFLFFDYDESEHVFFEFMLLEVCWTSSVGKYISFPRFGKFLAIISLNNISLHWFLPPPLAGLQ